jgi:putative peptide zinc metalloprotease protein
VIATAPRFRNDLTESQQFTHGETWFVLKDPLRGKFFRLRETERFVARQLDGENSLDAIRRNTEAKFGAPLAPETLNAFVKKLEQANLLESGKKGGGPGRRIVGNPLMLRIRLLDPDRLFNDLIQRVGFLFTPQFMVFSAASILMAVGITIGNWREYVADLPRLYHFSAIPAIVWISFMVVSAHEFGHGLTCKRFGGEVHEIGFMMMYFQPALYCNVSDAWLFPEKSKRLWVGFAGPYFELFLWSLATMAWYLTNADTRINYVGLIVMTTSGIKTLINFNPFIKLDGYYLLSDFLEIPNLRAKSFKYVGGVIESMIGLRPAGLPRLSVREKYIFLLYGSSAAIGTFSLLAYVLFSAGSSMIEGKQPLAVLVSLGLLTLRFRQRLQRLFGKGSATGGPTDDFDDIPDSLQGHPAVTAEVEPAAPESAVRAGATPDPAMPETPLVESKKPRKKRGRKIERWKLWAAIGTAVLAILVFGRTELRVSGPFAVLPAHNADVRSEIDGMIEHIYVSEGDAVRQGDLLARLSDRENRNELQKTTEEIRQSRSKLRMLQAGPTAEEINLAKTGVEKAEEHLKYAQARLERDKLMFQKDLISQKNLEDTQELAVIADKDLAEAQGKLTVLVKGARPEEIEGTRAEISRLEAQKNYLEGQLKRVEVRSPATGIVATPARQLKEMERQVIQKGALIAKVYEVKTLTVEIAVPEKEMAEIRVGQKVVLKARAYPDETFSGTVASIATSVDAGTSGSESTPRTILITTEIDNASLLLKPQMTGQAKISCGELRIISLMMRQLARTVKVDFWSWW